MNQIERFKKMQEDAKKGKAKGFQSSLDDLRQNTQFYGKAKAPVKAPIKSVSPSYVPEDGDIFSSAGMGYAPAVERPTYKGNAWLDSNIFFGSKREKASKMYELDKITQARLSNDFASDPMRFAGQRTRDVVRNYAPNPYAAVELTDAGEDLVNNSKFGKNVIKPILSGYYDTMRSKSAGRELLYGSDSTEAVSEYGKLADKYRPEQSSGLVDRTLKGLWSFGGQMMANYGTPEMALGLMAGGVGGKVAAAKGSLELGTGALYLDMVEQGVDKETAKAIAMGGGMINAGLEMAQLDEIIKGLKVARGNPIATGAIIGGIQRAGLTEAVERALGSKVGSFVTKTALPVAANWAKGVAKETGQELMQEAVSIGSENIGKYQSGIELDKWSDVGRRLKDTAIDSALTFGAMGVPGAIGGAYHNNITPYSPKTQNKANLGGIVEDGAIHQEAVQSPNVVQPALPDGAEKQASYNPVRDGGPIEEVRAFQNENAQRMAQIGKRLGARVEFFEGDPFVNGHYKDGKISINVNSERSTEYVFGHELYHFLRDQTHNQELDKLTNFLLGEAKDLLLPEGDLNSLIQAKVEQYNSYGEKLEGYQAKEELLADAVGKLLENEGAIERLVRYDQNMFQKVRYWVEDMIARFRGTPEERRFLQAHKLLERAVEKSTGIVSGESSGAYSYVGTDSNGIRHYESDMKGYTNNEAIGYFEAMAHAYLGNNDIQMDFNGNTLNVDLHSNFVNETLHQNPKSLKKVIAKLLPDLADIIEHANWTHSKPENQNKIGSARRQQRHKNFNYWDYFKTTIFMDGNPYEIRVNVVNDFSGNRDIYQVQANKKAGVTGAATMITPSTSNAVTPTLSVNTVPQQSQVVNPQGANSLGGELVMPGGMMENVPEGEFKTRSFYQSASGSGRVHPEVRQNLLQNIESEAAQAMYRVQSNDETKAMVRQRINDMGVDQLEAAIDYKIANNEKMKAEDMLSAIGLIEHYSKTGELERAQNMIADLSVIATELGQAVQVMRLMKALTPQGALMRIEKSLQKINADLKPHQKIVLSDDRRADILNSEMGSDDMRRAVIMAEAEINQKVPADWWAKWNAWRYLSMLGNPRTHIRNIVGNGLFVLPKSTKDVFGAVTESIVSRTIDPTMERTKTLRPVDRDLKLVADHLFRDYQANLTGHGKENTMLDRRIFNTKALEGLRRFNSNMLEAEDAFFLGKHFKTSVAKYLKANHIKASDIANIVLDKDGRKTVQMRQPNDRTGQILADAIEYGISEAQKATFRDFNRLSNEINRLKKRGRGWQVGLDAVAPFTQTPLNIMRRGYEYSPLGAIEGIKKAIQSSKDGSVSTADIIDAFSASASGTATTFVLGMMLAKAGLVTGDEEDDEKALNDLEQNQNYALQIGGHSFTLDWAAPMSLPFFLGVETYNVTKGKDFFDSLGNLTDSATKLADPMVNMSMLQGLNRITKEFKYADSPSAALSNATVSALSGYVGQGVPTLGGQIARTIDGTRRTKYIDKNSGVPKVFQQFKNDVQSKIPGLESKLPAYIDPFGREEKTGSNWASRALQNMVLPGFYSKKPNDKVTQEIRKLYESSGDRAVIPKGAVRYVDGNYGKKFTPSEYEAYNKTKGTKTHELLKDVISAKGYQKLSEQEKIDQIKSAMEYAKELANNKHLGKPLGKKHQEMKDLEKKGMSFGEISGYEMAKKAFEEAKKGDKVKATRINPFADLKLKGKEREDYILSQMSDAAQRKWEHVKARGVADADTYYMTYMVVTSSAGGEKRKKEDKIKDLLAMGYSEDQAYAIFEVITSKKKKWN